MFGREREREILDRLLAGRRGGVLVLHGDAGVGKTALLEYAIEAGRQYLVARTSGVEAEMELPFAALLQLCSPFIDLLDRLPQPQHEAFGVAFGLSSGSAPNPFLVGLAVLGLLSEAAEERPLLVVVDDAHWLDHASARALAFVARRLLAEQIVLVVATRQVEEPLRGLPELFIPPLGHRDARALLESVLPAPLDEPVLERVVAETRGNPLALLELPRGLTPTELAGGFRLPVELPLSAGIETMPVACCSWRRPIRSGIPRSYGARWSDSESQSRLPTRSSLRTCWSLTHGWCSVIRWFVRRSTGQPLRTNDARPTARWQRRPIRNSIRIVEPGTGRRRPRSPMRRLPRSWRSRQPGRKRAVVTRPPRRSWNEPRR